MATTINYCEGLVIVLTFVCEKTVASPLQIDISGMKYFFIAVKVDCFDVAILDSVQSHVRQKSSAVVLQPPDDREFSIGAWSP